MHAPRLSRQNNYAIQEYRKLPPDLREKLKQFAFARNLSLAKAMEICGLKTQFFDKKK